MRFDVKIKACTFLQVMPPQIYRTLATRVEIETMSTFLGGLLVRLVCLAVNVTLKLLSTEDA